MASGDTLFIFLPEDNIPPATAYATYDTFAATTGVRSVLDFAGDTGSGDETAIFAGSWPSHYGDGGVNVVAWYSTDGTSTSAIQLEVSAEVMQDLDLTDTGAGQDFGTLTDIADTPGAGGVNALNKTAAGSISHANCGSPNPGDLARFKVTRDFDHATNTDDLQLHAIVVTEQ